MSVRFRSPAYLGAGGMGEVHRARDPKLNRDIAHKILRSFRRRWGPPRQVRARSAGAGLAESPAHRGDLRPRSSRRFRVDPDLRNAPTWGHFRYTASMAQLKVRQLDDQVAAALKRRAESRGVSLEEEVRSMLTTAVAARRSAMERRARSAITGKPGSRALDAHAPSAANAMPTATIPRRAAGSTHRCAWGLHRATAGCRAPARRAGGLAGAAADADRSRRALRRRSAAAN